MRNGEAYCNCVTVMKHDIDKPCPFAQSPATTSPATSENVVRAVALPHEFARFGTVIF